MTHQVNFPLTIYYDQSCPMCAEEMYLIKSMDTQDNLLLVDCSAAGFSDSYLQARGISQLQLMNCIHARDQAGVLYQGIDVFEICYAQAGFKRIAKILGVEKFRPLWDRLYPLVVRNRQLFSRLGLPSAYSILMSWLARRSNVKTQHCKNPASTTAHKSIV